MGDCEVGEVWGILFGSGIGEVRWKWVGILV